MRLSGADTVAPGQVLAIGAGPRTPDGFLGEVVSVAAHGDVTVVQTRPATLPEAVAQGAFDVSMQSAQVRLGQATRRAMARAAEQHLVCTGKVSAGVDPELSFGTGIELSSSWSWRGLGSVGLTASANAPAR